MNNIRKEVAAILNDIGLTVIFTDRKQTCMNYDKKKVWINMNQLNDIYDKPDTHRRKILTTGMTRRDFILFAAYHEKYHYLMAHRTKEELMEKDKLADEYAADQVKNL